MDVLLIDMDLAHDFGQWVVERGGVGGARQRPELGNHATRAAWLRSPRYHLLDVNRDGVALHRAIDHDRTILRIDKRHAQLLRGHVLLGLKRALEGIAGLDDHPISRLDMQHRLRVRSHGVVELPLLGLGEFVGRARRTLGDARGVHDRCFQPVAHGEVSSRRFRHQIARYFLMILSCARSPGAT